MTEIIYLSSFLFSEETVRNPNIYPYNVFAEKAEKLLLFRPITILYGNNASGKSTMLNKMARFLGCQFIIATHSPFMLGTLNAKIYNIDSKELEETKWTELENVRYFYEFFEKHRGEFVQ